MSIEPSIRTEGVVEPAAGPDAENGNKPEDLVAVDAGLKPAQQADALQDRPAQEAVAIPSLESMVDVVVAEQGVDDVVEPVSVDAKTEVADAIKLVEKGDYSAAQIGYNKAIESANK